MRNFTTLTTFTLMSLVANANPIDETKAKLIAQEYLVPGNSMTLVHKAKRNPSKMRKVSNITATTSPYYIYSRGEGKGYVVVSGDDCLPEVLGFTESGDFDAGNLPPALADMLQGYADAIEDAQVAGNNKSVTTTLAKRRAASTRSNIAPFATSHWHQDWPYNIMTPNRTDNGAKSTVGCVSTAASQILYYWRKDLPSTLQSTTPTYSEDGYSHASVTVSLPKGTPILWDLMLDSYGSAPSEYNNAVATLCYGVGTATHLEYSVEGGTATSGHIEDIPNTFKNYFGMNGGWVAYRASYNQEGWTQLIYNELTMGRPVMYTGVHPTSGGHAVFIHGYQASSDKFYFNFGWGGQGDGYWTTTLEDGMNGFNDYQSALIGAYPKTWNLNASIGLPAHTYSNIDNTFNINIENNSTLDFKGLYIFASSSTTKPSSLKDAKSSDETTIIKKGEKGVISLTAKPTTAKLWYITVTDANLNVLDKQEVMVESADAKLELWNIAVNGSNENETIGNHTYTKIYNTKASILAQVVNTSKVAFGGTAKIDIYQSDDNGDSFTLFKTVTKSNVTINAESSSIIDFSPTGLSSDKLYYASIHKEWGTLKPYTKVSVPEQLTDTAVYIKSAGASDLEAELNKETGVLTFTGHWDPSQYETIVSKASNKTATSYDLTSVQSIAEIPNTSYPNPNALIYANEGLGTNVVNNNNIGYISLTAGYDFCPQNDLRNGVEGCININQEPNRWYLLTVPFTVKVPNGIIARRIDSHRQSTSGINNATTNVTTLLAGQTYLVMTSSKEKQILVATCADDAAESESTTILSKPTTNTDPSVIGTYASSIVPAGAKIVKDKETDKQYFMATEEEYSEGLRGYFYDDKMTTSATDFRAYSSTTLDPLYVTFGQAIQNLYDVRDTYASTVSEEANKAMADTIANAEMYFSNQTFTTASTTKKYISELEEWINVYKTMVDNSAKTEIDMTTIIVNPSFEESPTTAKGWTSEISTDTKIRKNSDLSNKTVYGDGALYAHNNTGSKIYQELSNLKPGYYRLSSKIGCEDGFVATLFADENTANVSAHEFGNHYLSEAVIDSILVNDGGKLTIGVMANSWYNVDDFRLTFIGSKDIDTAIDYIYDPSEKKTKQGIYTIQGQKVNKIVKAGLYIIDGKKTWIK